jgi:hypothetical protein
VVQIAMMVDGLLELRDARNGIFLGHRIIVTDMKRRRL